VTSTSAYRGTLAALIELLRRDPPGCVVPGHGPELTAATALAVAEADLAYLWELHDAVALGTTREDAREAGLAVELPRPAADDLAQAQVATSRRPWPNASRRRASVTWFPGNG
jgi:hypothetical protein